jgi:hypothetical protein
MSESEARYKCSDGQIGKYRFDVSQSIIDSTTKEKWETLSGLEIVFEKDSTFYTNKMAFFLDDTVGRWDAGTCGFESAGKIKFLSSPHEINFSPSRSDSFFTIQGKYSNRLKKSQQYYFRRL